MKVCVSTLNSFASATSCHFICKARQNTAQKEKSVNAKLTHNSKAVREKGMVLRWGTHPNLFRKCIRLGELNHLQVMLVNQPCSWSYLGTGFWKLSQLNWDILAKLYNREGQIPARVRGEACVPPARPSYGWWWMLWAKPWMHYPHHWEPLTRVWLGHFY